MSSLNLWYMCWRLDELVCHTWTGPVHNRKKKETGKLANTTGQSTYFHLIFILGLIWAWNVLSLSEEPSMKLRSVMLQWCCHTWVLRSSVFFFFMLVQDYTVDAIPKYQLAVGTLSSCVGWFSRFFFPVIHWCISSASP